MAFLVPRALTTPSRSSALGPGKGVTQCPQGHPAPNVHMQAVYPSVMSLTAYKDDSYESQNEYLMCVRESSIILGMGNNREREEASNEKCYPNIADLKQLDTLSKMQKNTCTPSTEISI